MQYVECRKWRLNALEWLSGCGLLNRKQSIILMVVPTQLKFVRFVGAHAGWLLAALVLAALAWWLRAPLHALPLERDEGAYAIIATRMMAGDVLYRELFDHKPTLVTLWPSWPLVIWS
jgi:hypothetical protein